MLLGTQVLVVSTHPQHCKPLVLALDKLNVKTAVAFSAAQAIEILTTSDIPVVCTCAELPDGDYRLLLKAIRRGGGKSRLLVMTPKDDCPDYLDAMRRGVYDFLLFPFQSSEVERIIGNALHAVRPTHVVAKTA